MKILDWIQIPEWDRIRGTAAGRAVSVTGSTPALAAAAAARLAGEGRRVLLVAEHDLKAAKLADDVRQLTGEDCPFLPGGEIDLTRAAGSQESSWRRLEALSAVTGHPNKTFQHAECIRKEYWLNFVLELHFIFIYPGTAFYSTAQKRYFKQYLTCLAQVTTTRRAI